MKLFCQSSLYRVALLLILWVAPSYADEPPPPYTIVEDQARLPILTPDLAERKVLKLRLANGLEAFLISDPKADKSAAALTVKVGSWDDPKEYPGLAHFLEHMLFLGTKKYPQESGYDRFISQNGGMANAFTTDSYTSYMFSVNNSAFEEGLDRFSYFFKEPLFNPSGVARELQAIDQEYAKNLENDDWRVLYIDKELSNPDHPFHDFHSGNSASLAKVSQDTLIKWYQEHYSSNLMRLIVYSPLPLDKIRELVVADFQGIPNKNKQASNIDKPISSSETHEHIVYVEPVKDARSLSLIWELPSQFAHMPETQPANIVCNVLGHEGEESLLAQLKRENLAEKIKCSGEQLGANAFLLVLEIQLTDEGVKQVNEVIERSFQAIANFKQKEVPQYLFDEIHRMAEISYQYQPRQDVFQFVMAHARWYPEESLETYPEHSSIIQKFDPKAVKDLLNQLTPQNAHIFLVAPSTITNEIPDRQEKWVGAKYSIKEIGKEQIAKWSQATSHTQIDIPAPNPLIPQKLTLVTKNSVSKDNYPNIQQPKAIVNEELGMIYFSPDQRYDVPQISWIFEIKTPHVNMGNALDEVLADLYVKSVNEALNSISYPASIAGLSYSIAKTEYGILLSIEGYSENAELLFDEILKKLKVQPTEQEFNVFKESLMRQYQNFDKQTPLEQASEFLKNILYKNFTRQQQKAQKIKKVTFNSFNAYANELFNQVYVEGMLYGNMTEKQAHSIASKLFAALGNKPYSKGKSRRPQVILLSDKYKKAPIYQVCQTKAQGNAAILAIENASFSFKEKAAQQVLMQAMKSSFFATLRTKQQTGYIVYSGDREIEKQLFNLFAVQSNTHSPRDLLARFELFIEGYLQELTTEIPEDSFNSIKQVLIETLQQPPKSVEEMGRLLQKLAFDYEGDFAWITKRIQGFNELTYPEFITITNNFMGRQNKRRIAILLNGRIPKDKEFDYTPIKNVNLFRRSQEYSE